MHAAKVDFDPTGGRRQLREADPPKARDWAAEQRKFLDAIAPESHFHRAFDGLGDTFFFAKNLAGETLFFSRGILPHIGLQSEEQMLGATDEDLTPGPFAAHLLDEVPHPRGVRAAADRQALGRPGGVRSGILRPEQLHAAFPPPHRRHADGLPAAAGRGAWCDNGRGCVTPSDTPRGPFPSFLVKAGTKTEEGQESVSASSRACHHFARFDPTIAEISAR